MRKYAKLKMRNIRSHGSIFASPLGGDVEKIGHFQWRNIRSHGSIFLASPLRGDVEKIEYFQRGEHAFTW